MSLNVQPELRYPGSPPGASTTPSRETNAVVIRVRIGCSLVVGQRLSSLRRATVAGTDIRITSIRCDPGHNPGARVEQHTVAGFMGGKSTAQRGPGTLSRVGV